MAPRRVAAVPAAPPLATVCVGGEVSGAGRPAAKRMGGLARWVGMWWCQYTRLLPRTICTTCISRRMRRRAAAATAAATRTLCQCVPLPRLRRTWGEVLGEKTGGCSRTHRHIQVLTYSTPLSVCLPDYGGVGGPDPVCGECACDGDVARPGAAVCRGGRGRSRAFSRTGHGRAFGPMALP
jgi:hypothetical protein